MAKSGKTVIETPLYVIHMSFGALAKGSTAVKTAMCAVERGILDDSLESSRRYILEYVLNKYGANLANLKRVDSENNKIKQGTKTIMGSHLPGVKVTEEIARMRDFLAGSDIISPARFSDITNRDELRWKVDQFRHESGGRPIGIDIAAGDIEGDLEAELFAEPDFISIDGRSGSKRASAKFVKDATSFPIVFALTRARRYFLEQKVTGKYPAGIAVQDPELRARLNVDEAARTTSPSVISALPRRMY
jgi:methylamine---glutamate N-methyltransferase subunit C